MAKPRKFTPEFKAKVALAALKGDKPLAVLCREHQLSDTVVVRWRQQLLERAAALFAGQSPSNSADKRSTSWNGSSVSSRWS
jgi:transposase